MEQPPAQFSERGEPLDDLVAAYLQAEAAGNALDRAQFLQSHPEHASALREFFAIHDQLRQAAAHSTSSPPSPVTLGASSSARDLFVAEAPLRSRDSTSQRGHRPDSNTRAPAVPSESRRAPAAVLGGGEIFGDYQLLEEIARGGMGVVFKARQISLNRIVALKMIRSSQMARDEDLQRFRAEAIAAAQLDHPQIVPIYEVGELQGQPYFSMAFLEGERLSDRIKDGPLPPKEAAQLMQKIAEAVAFAHHQGVIHRDLKPGNVMFDAQGIPKVMDFGLAKRVEANEELTATGQVLGTPNYMSPEQAAAKNKAVGQASDIYSMGATLYALLTGRPPFQSAGVAETLFQVVHQEPVAPRSLNSLVPRDLETICLKCLDKQPHHRYRQARDLADDLNRYLRHEPITARRHHPLSRLVRWARRNPAAAGLGWGLLTAVLLVVTISLGAAIQLSSARNMAYRNEQRAVSAERETRNQLWRSYLNEAQSRRWSGRHGRRFEGLRALQAASEIREGPQLRNEAIACLTLADARPLPFTFDFDLSHDLVAFDRQYATFAHAKADGQVTLRRFPDGQQLATFPPTGDRAMLMRFDASGKLLAVKWHGAPRLAVYDVVRGESIFQTDDVLERAVDFSPDGTALTLATNRGAMRTYHLPRQEWLQEFTTDSRPSTLRYSPDGMKLAAASPSGVHVWQVDNRQVLQRWSPCEIRDVAWHPDSRLVAGAGADMLVHIWDSVTGEEDARLLGHESQITDIEFSQDDGAYLASYDWQSTVRLWDHGAGIQLLNVPNISGDLEAGLQFSPDNQYLFQERLVASGLRVWEVALPHEFAILKPPPGTLAYRVYDMAVSPDGQILVAGTDHYLHFWDLSHRRYLGRIGPVPSVSVEFDPVGQNLVSAGWETIARWPWRRQSLDLQRHHSDHATLVIDDPETLWSGTHRVTDIVVTPQAICAADRVGRVVVLNRDNQAEQTLEPPTPRTSFHLAVSQDGKWLATGRNGGGADIWNLNTREFATYVHVDGFNDAPVSFSPDGRHLVVGGRSEFVFWRVGTWQREKQIPRKAGAPAFAFSPDGSIFACADTSDTIRILEGRTLQELCRLDTPQWTYLSCLSFTPDGSTLLAGTERLEIFAWQLSKLQDRLDGIRLGWPTERFPSAVARDLTTLVDLHYSADPRSTSPIPVLERQANQSFQQGAYAQAGKQLQLAAELTAMHPMRPFLVPVLYVMGNDLPAYQRYCRWMLGIHQQSRDAERLARAAMHSCISAPTGENLDIAIRCARSATDIDPQHYLMRLFDVTRALAEHRAGNHREAIAWADKVLDHKSVFWASHPLARLVRSMARIQLREDADQVRADLELVQAALDQQAEKYADAVIEMGHVEYRICQLLYGEASQQLQVWLSPSRDRPTGDESSP